MPLDEKDVDLAICLQRDGRILLSECKSDVVIDSESGIKWSVV